MIFSLIVELATYERAADQVVGSEELLERALFGPHPAAEALIAEVALRTGRLCALLHHVLDLAVPSGYLARGPLRP